MTHTPTRWTVDARVSTVCFVYPFADTAHDQFARRVAAINAQTWGTSTAFLWRTKNYAEVDDLLPYVANYLTPEHERDGDVGAVPTAQFWTLNLREQEGTTTRWAAPRGEGVLAVAGRGDAPTQSWRFTVDEIQLALFGHGVGFLAFWVTPLDAPYIEDWMTFVHHFRTPVASHGRRVTIDMWRVATHNGRTRYTLAPPSNPLPADGAHNFMALRDTLLGTAALDRQVWWKDAYVRDQLLPYAVYYLDTPARFPRTPTPEMMTVLFKIRKFFGGDHEVMPTDADLDPNHPTLLPYALHMWFSFSLNGATFTAFNAPANSVYRRALARTSLPEAYFLLFLLTLQQRFTLMALSESVADRWLPALKRSGRGGREDRRAAFATIQDTFLAFTARSYFAQVIQGERHHNYYRKWQDVFQVPQLYAEVRDALEQMRDYMELRETRQLNEAVQFLTALSIILAALSAIAAWWSMNFEGMPQPTWPSEWPVAYVVLNVVAALVVLLTTLFFWRKRWIFRGRRGR